MNAPAVHRGPRPPANPVEGKRWRDTDSRVIYAWQGGRGWVAERLYQPPQGRRAEQAMALGLVPPEPEPEVRAAPQIGPRALAPQLVASSPPSIERASLAVAPLIDHTAAWRALFAALGALRLACRPPAAPAPAEPRVPPARAPVAVVEPERDRSAHPILARHARQIDAGRPLDDRAKPRRREPPPAPEFSPEFLAKLARVAAGAGIVEVQPISRRADPEGLQGSSLSFEV
jgi:hypothetical protein